MTAFGAWGSSPSSRRWTSRGGLDVLGRRPVPGQQLGQTGARPALGHTIDDIGEIGVRIESVEPGRFDDRVYVCRAQATFVAAQEEEILPRYGDGPQSSLGDIVIYGETAVAGIARERLPTAAALRDCLAKWPLQGQSSAFLLEPTLELDQQGHGTGLPLGESDIGGITLDLSLDGVERTYPTQRFLRDRRLGRVENVEEVPACMRHTLHVRDAGQRVAGIGICLQKAGETGEVLRRALALPIRAVAIEGCRSTLTRPGPLVDGIDPKSARGRAAFAGGQNLDGCVVGVDYRRAHDMLASHFGQRRNPPSEMAHPIGHDRALDLDAVVAFEDLGLAVERQAVVVLRDRYMADEVWTWPSLEDWQIGCRRLRDHFARAAGVDRTNVTNDLELRGDLLEDFGYLFTDFGAGSGVIAAAGELGLEDDDLARKMIGERLAHCRPPRPRGGLVFVLSCGVGRLGGLWLGLRLGRLRLFAGALERLDLCAARL